MTLAPKRSRSTSRCGLTLLETLGVVTLMTLAASLAARGLSGATDDAQRRAGLSTVRDVDAKARLLSSSEPVELTVAEDRGSLIVRRGLDVVLSQELPARSRAHLLVDGEPADLITYTSTGTSPDFTVYLEVGGSVTRIEIAGLTGWPHIHEPNGTHP